ncbi:MAG TPA: hypothetical protein VFO96_09300 [Gemmatimonadales bacterium]|jgi:hypothetical protein|nr:hypothetical protein [Gemmatimonadales bacterium]
MNDDDFVKDEQSSVVGHRSSDDRRLTTDDLAQEPLDETLLTHARSYNAPGDMPREEMWQAIAGRTGRTGRTRVLPFRRVIRVALPIAAVLAVGIYVGRMTTVDGQRSTVDGPGSSSVIARPQSGRSNRVALTTDSGDPIASSAPTAPPRNDSATRDSRPVTRDPRPSTLDSRPSTAFAVAAERHFAQAETFLTLFRASVREGKDESLAPAAARELLVSNRLLMDSPAADDPKVSRLLDDIELVLAQIAQLPVEDKQADAQMITDGLEAGGILTRIRTEVTSGPVAAVPQGAL